MNNFNKGVNMKYISKKASILSLFVTGVLIGCGGSSSPAQSSDSGTVAQALLGPISEGNFTIKRLNTGTKLTSGQTTTGEKPNVEQAGLIVLDQSTKDNLDVGLYLVEVTGGTDIDSDDNGVWDETPTPNLGTLHAIMSDTQLKNGGFKVNILTEIVYQNIDTKNLTQQEIKTEITKKTKELVKDVDGDGDIDGDDLVAWNPASDKQKLKVDYDDNLKPIVNKVLNDKNISSISSRLFLTNSKSKLLKTGQIESYYIKDDGDLQIGKTRVYSRDDITNIVTNSTTHLMWQDDNNSKTTKKWQDAIDYCDNLELGNFSDWRLSSINELFSLVNYGKMRPSTDEIFKNIDKKNYWSSTLSANNNNMVKIVDFELGRVSVVSKNSDLRFRCVRDIGE
jgi:hypothetical protein